MPLAVHPLDRTNYDAWNQFVVSHPHGSPMHTTHWMNSIKSVFHYRPLYRIAMDGAEVAGVLPLFLVSNPIIGRILLSTPFAVYGGILASNAEAHTALRDEAVRLARENAVDYLELRNGFPEQLAGFTKIDRYVTFTQNVLPADGEALLQALQRKLRNIVRKSLKFPYSSRIAGGVEMFYGLLCRVYRSHGTPVFPRKWFETLRAEFGPMVDVREVLLEGEVVAVSFNFHFQNQMHVYYAASDYRHLDKAPNNFLYYDHLLWAGRNGCSLFDFGRSKVGTGGADFKKQWITEMRELPYEILLVKRKDLPNFSQTNVKFELLSRVWQKLPLAVTRLLGPPLVRLFP